MKKNKTMKRAYELIKPYKETILIVSILSAIISAVEILKPYLIKTVIDDYITLGVYQKGIITIGMIGAGYIILVIVGNIIDFVATTTTNMMGEDAIYQLRNKFYRFIQYSNITFHDNTSAGKLFVRITNDIEDIAILFKDVITTFIKDFLLIFALMGIMIFFSFKLSALVFIIIPLVIISSVVITNLLNKAYAKSKVIRTKLNSFFAESIYGLKLIKVFSRQKEKQEECEKLGSEFLQSRKITGVLEGLIIAIMLLLENLGIAIITWAVMYKWMGIKLDIGIVYIFTTYIKQIFEPINRIVENVETVQEALVSIDRVYEILEQRDALENTEKGMQLKEIKGKIEFKNVWFSYDDKTWVLKDVSFTIEQGQSIALVGKTGSGKTTITNLMNRFYDIQQGEILIDGINIKNINLHTLRKKVGIILQEPFIFARTIRDNIRLNNQISDEEIQKALRLSSADGFVNALPNGLDEISVERGAAFSAGEKQLLSFARIFANDPAIFILDEATANIDTHTESLIQKSIDHISAQKTSIFIAHRLSTIVNVDKIIVLNKGEIVEMGNHNELVNTGGYYAKLYQSYYDSLQNGA